MVVITITTTTILILNLTILRIIIEQLIIFTIFKLCIRRYLQKLKKKLYYIVTIKKEQLNITKEKS